jgi:hypothetical protein
MRVIGIGSVFADDLLVRLPIGYRFMVQIAADSFGENYVGKRFSASAQHQSRNYRCVAPNKPVSSLVVQDYLINRRDEH